MRIDTLNVHNASIVLAQELSGIKAQYISEQVSLVLRDGNARTSAIDISLSSCWRDRPEQIISRLAKLGDSVSCEGLSNKLVRVATCDGRVLALGHIIKDIWFPLVCPLEPEKLDLNAAMELLKPRLPSHDLTVGSTQNAYIRRYNVDFADQYAGNPSFPMLTELSFRLEGAYKSFETVKRQTGSAPSLEEARRLCALASVNRWSDLEGKVVRIRLQPNNNISIEHVLAERGSFDAGELQQSKALLTS